ncbi:hypothetical protein CAEBREN_14475 [Caenorhabditis brenneri]|uniref:EF-hand domain-containing protein n=1 Tax=Caenorhabditis brenneri TaxID=135651 RepID=G0P7A4_CAEBE|nr:hypothetical protein CAEBREN_14475 [Caenorhabditis brenneri]
MTAPNEDGWVHVTRNYGYPGKIEKDHLDANFSYFVCKDIRFQSNLMCFGEEEFKRRGAKYFLMIGEDMKEFCDVKENRPVYDWIQYPTGMLDNLTDHARINAKRLVIREFTYKDSGIPIDHVLTEDVLEMIRIFMKRQKREPESYTENLAELEQKWKNEDSNFTRSISTEEFKMIMNEFEIDKSQIVIAPDVQSYISTLRTLYNGFGPITTYNRDGNLIMTTHQAVFNIFQSTVFGYNWHELKKNPYTQKKLDEFYKFFMKVTKKYWDMEEGLLVTLSHVEKDIKNLKNHKIFVKKWAKKIRLYPYENSKYSDEISLKHLFTDYVNIGVSCMRNASDYDGNGIPVHLARAYILFAHMGIFFPVESIEQKIIMVDGMLTVMNFQSRKENRKMFLKLIYDKAGKADSEIPPESDFKESDKKSGKESDEKSDEDKNEEELADTDVSPSNEEKTSDMNDEALTTSEAAESTDSTNETNSNCCSQTDHSAVCLVVPNNFDPATAVAKNQTFKLGFTCCGVAKLIPFTAPLPKPKVIAHPVLLSDRCNQCYENLGKLKTAEENLKNSENKAKLYEKQAIKIEELEKEMEILKTKRKNADKHRMKAKEKLDEAVNLATKNEKRAMEANGLEDKLKIKNAKLVEYKKEIEELKMTINSQPDLAQKVIMLEERHKNQELVARELRKSNKEFKSQNADLKKQLESQGEKIAHEQKQFANKYRKMQDEMAGNRKISDELATQNLTLVKENDQLKHSLVSEKVASEEKSDINARLLNEKTQLHQKIKDLERQLQKSN